MSATSFIRIEDVQMGAHVLKLYKELLYARNPVKNNALRSTATKLSLVPASPYNCDVK